VSFVQNREKYFGFRKLTITGFYKEKNPQERVINLFPRDLFFFFCWWYKFQQITNLTIQHCTEPSKNVYIQSSDLVSAVVVDLCPLHLCPMAQHIFTKAGFFQKIIQLDPNGSIFHLPTLLLK